MTGGHTAFPPSKIPLPSEVPQVPVEKGDGSDPCKCFGGVTNGVCYTTLAAAIQEASNGGTITVGGKQTVTAPIYFEKDVSYVPMPK